MLQPTDVISDFARDPGVVLSARMVGRQMNPKFLRHRSDHHVALIPHVVEPLMIIGSGRDLRPVPASRRPFRAIQKQDGVRFELRIGPGVMRDIAAYVVVVIGNAEIVHADGLRKRDDLCLRIIAGVLAVPGVHVKIALEPHPSLRLAMGGSGPTSVGAQGFLLWLDCPTVELLMQLAMINPATKTCTRILIPPRNTKGGVLSAFACVDHSRQRRRIIGCGY
jgi:hypothetical protein